jgi:hypothetical protein
LSVVRRKVGPQTNHCKTNSVSTTDGLSQLGRLERTAREWPIRAIFAASIFFVLALGLILVVRRFSGALTAPLPPAQLVVAAIMLLAWAVAVRTLMRSRIEAWLLTGVLVLFAVGCSFPAQRAIDWLVWLTALGAFVGSQQVSMAAPIRRSPANVAGDRVLQQLTRTRTADGHEIVHGTLLAEFAPGERTATLYVAFCPPFERLPHVEVESAADVRILQTLHNGVQLEVRQHRSATVPTTTSIELFATDAIDG